MKLVVEGMSKTAAVVRGAFMGFMVVCIIIGTLLMLSAFVNYVLAGDAVPTYEARLGEQDRSLNPYPGRELTDLMLTFSGTTESVYLSEGDDGPYECTCTCVTRTEKVEPHPVGPR